LNKTKNKNNRYIGRPILDCVKSSGCPGESMCWWLFCRQP